MKIRIIAVQNKRRNFHRGGDLLEASKRSILEENTGKRWAEGLCCAPASKLATVLSLFDESYSGHSFSFPVCTRGVCV